MPVEFFYYEDIYQEKHTVSNGDSANREKLSMEGKMVPAYRTVVRGVLTEKTVEP